MFKLIKKSYVKHLNKQVEKYWNIYHFDMNPNHTSHNNEADAFKHCFWQAEMTLFFGQKIAKFLGDKHEDRPDNPDNEKAMDLHNNERGRIIGEIVKTIEKHWLFKGYDDVIAELVMDSMRTGKLITKVCYEYYETGEIKQ